MYCTKIRSKSWYSCRCLLYVITFLIISKMYLYNHTSWSVLVMHGTVAMQLNTFLSRPGDFYICRNQGIISSKKKQSVLMFKYTTSYKFIDSKVQSDLTLVAVSLVWV